VVIELIVSIPAAAVNVFPVRGWGRYAPAFAVLMSIGLAVPAAGTVLAVWARRHLGPQLERPHRVFFRRLASRACYTVS